MEGEGPPRRIPNDVKIGQHGSLRLCGQTAGRGGGLGWGGAGGGVGGGGDGVKGHVTQRPPTDPSVQPPSTVASYSPL